MISLSSLASLPSGEGSGAVVKRGWERWAVGFTSRHRSDLARSTFNGGRLCSGGGALGHLRFLRREIVVVDDKCPSFSVGGSRQ